MFRRKIVYMIGFMGSGKTTAGKKLASSLGWSFIDLDRIIEESLEMSIPEIFEKLGEEHFRETEAELLRFYSKKENTVLSTGGGVPCFGDNMQFMLDTGLTIYLKLTPDQLVSRLAGSSDARPLLKGLKGEGLLAYVQDKLREREAFYEKSEIKADGFSADIPSIVRAVKNSFVR